MIQFKRQSVLPSVPIVLAVRRVLLYSLLTISRRIRTAAAAPDVMFTQRLNAATGKYEWVVVDIDAGDETQEGLLSTTTYSDMLNDVARNRAYHRAILSTVRPDDVVLDIGTGTGLLAMMAAKHIQRQGGSGKVYACEVYPPSAAMAREIVKLNKLSDMVTVIDKRSDDLTVGIGQDLPRRVDVIVSEVLDSELIGEGVLSVMQHAVRRLLKPGGRMVPHAAKAYAQLLEAPILMDFADTRRAGQLLSSLGHPGGSGLPNCVADPPANCHNLHSHLALDLDPFHARGQLVPLSPPVEVFDFEFLRPAHVDRRRTVQVPIVQAGTAHGVAFWWEAQLDASNASRLSTTPSWVRTEQGRYRDSKESIQGCTGNSGQAQSIPFNADAGVTGTEAEQQCGDQNEEHKFHAGRVEQLQEVRQQWREHWTTCWFALQTCPGMKVGIGDELQLHSTHDDLNFSFSLNHQQRSQTQHAADRVIGAAQECAHSTLQHCWSGSLRNLLGPSGLGALNAGLQQYSTIVAEAVRQYLHSLQSENCRSVDLHGAEARCLDAHDAQSGVLAKTRVAVGGDLPIVLAAVLAQGSQCLQVLALQANPVLQRLLRQLTEALLAAPANLTVTSTAELLSATPDASASEAMCTAQTTVYQAGGTAEGHLEKDCDAVQEAAGQLRQCAGNESGVASSTSRVDGYLAWPAFLQAEALPPWSHAVRMWFERDELVNAGVLPVTAPVLPLSGTLWGVGVSVPDFQRARRAVSWVEGFDLRPGNRLMGGPDDNKPNTDLLVLARHHHQLGSQVLEMTDRLPLLRFNFNQRVNSLSALTKLPVTTSNATVCHAIMLWMQYGLSADGDHQVDFAPDQGHPAGAPRVGIALLNQPVAVPDAVTSAIAVQVSLLAQTGDLAVDVL